MSVGERIKLYLVQNNIHQYWLSEQAKIALPKLNASLNSKRKLSADEFEDIVIALKVDANLFLSKKYP